MKFRRWERQPRHYTPADLHASIVRRYREDGQSDRVKARLLMASLAAQVHEWGDCADALDAAREAGGCDLDNLHSEAIRLMCEQADRFAAEVAS